MTTVNAGNSNNNNQNQAPITLMRKFYDALAKIQALQATEQQDKEEDEHEQNQKELAKWIRFAIGHAKLIHEHEPHNQTIRGYIANMEEWKKKVEGEDENEEESESSSSSSSTDSD